MSCPDNGVSSPMTLQALARDFGSADDYEALVFLEKERLRRWRVRDFAAAVDRRARWLFADKGIRAHDPVIVCGPTSPDWIISFLAVMRCGACAVPTDAQFPDQTFEHVLRDSGARLVLAAQAAAKRFGHVCDEADVAVLPLEGPNGRESGGNPCELDGAAFTTVEPRDRAVLFYTSGTTGSPKGVPLTHANIVHQLDVLADSQLVAPSDRLLLPLPLHHVYPLVIGVLAPLALRVAIVLPDGFTGARILDALRRGKATLMIGVPRLYDTLIAGIEDRMAQHGKPVLAAYRVVMKLLRVLRRRFGWRVGRFVFSAFHQRIGPSLHTVVSGGSALKPETAWTLEAIGWRVGTGYGLTETSPLLTLNPPGEGRFETAGRPVRGIDLRVDREAGSVAEIGEVLARGAGVFAGYHNLDRETEQAFTADGWFRTGDLGRIDEAGSLHLAGRKSTLIVTPGGENVQPDEIEEAYEAHPAIAEIAVFQSDGRIVGLIVPDPALGRNGKTREAVARAVREASRRLPSYQRLAAFRLTRESLPRTRLGKTRRHLIEQRYARAGHEDGKATETASGPVALDELSADDRALLEDETAYATFRLLGAHFPGRRVIPDSDLRLDLGIDSIEWLDLSLEISERIGITLSEQSISEIDTVRDLLEQVARGGSDGDTVMAALEDPDSVLGAQQQRWLERPGRLARLVARMFAGLNGIIMRRYFRLRVRGLENLPDKAPFVITPNHASYLDPFALAAALGPARLDGFYWAGWTGVLFNGPVRRRFARVMRVLPVDPMKAAASSLAFGSAALERGLNLVWFPAGARSPDGVLKPFRPGIGLVLRHRPAMIVPPLIRVETV